MIKTNIQGVRVVEPKNFADGVLAVKRIDNGTGKEVDGWIEKSNLPKIRHASAETESLMILDLDRLAKNFEAWAVKHGGPWYAARSPTSSPWPSKAKRRNARLLRRQMRRETYLERCFL